MVSGLRPESGIVLTPEYEPGAAIHHLRFVIPQSQRTMQTPATSLQKRNRRIQKPNTDGTDAADTHRFFSSILARRTHPLQPRIQKSASATFKSITAI